MTSRLKHLWVCILFAAGSVKYVVSDCSFGPMNALTVTASSEDNTHKATDAFTETGWCASTDVKGQWLEINFTNGFGAKKFTIGSTVVDETSYPSSVLVQYVSNLSTDLTDFPLANSQPLIIHLNNTDTSSVGLSTGFAVKKLRFTLQEFKGRACMTVNVSGCTLDKLCSNPCQNGGQCVVEDTCRCQQGFRGQTCEMKPCTPEVLGLHDGRILQSNVLVSSEDPSFPKSQMGFDSSNTNFNTGWCAADNDPSPWVQIHFDETKSISTFMFFYINGQAAPKTYMRQFELQYIAPTDSARVYRTYATNVDSLNGTHVIQIDLLPPVITDTIRLVPTSVEGKACFKLELKGCDPRGLCQAGWCQNGGSCVGKDICKCPTGYLGDRCDKTKADINTPRIAFINITNNRLLTTSFTFSITGSVHIQQVNKENIIVINGTNSNIKLAQGTVGAECFHDIDTCTSGFTLTLEVKFGSLLDNTYIVSSGGDLPNHRGLALYYNQQHLTYVVTTTSQTWSVTVPYIPVVNVWQKFEITWSTNLGIGLYLNQKLLGTHSRPQQTSATLTGDLCIGCNPGQVSQVVIDMQIKEIHTWTVSRTELVNVGIVRAPIVTTRLPVQTSIRPVASSSTAPATMALVTTRLTTKVTTTRQPSTSVATKSTTANHGYQVYNMTLMKIVGSLLITPTFNFTVHGNPKLELQNNSQTALVLDCSKSQYVELLDHGIPCLQDLDNCQKGFTFHLEALFTKIDLQEKTYILTSGGDQNAYNGLALYLHSNLLTYGVKKGMKHWAASANIQNVIGTNTWHMFEISWMEQTGLLVLINGFEVIKEKGWTPSPGRSHSNPVLIGKSIDNNYTSCMKVRNLYTWTIQREILVTSGVLQEPRPPAITMTTQIDLLTLTYYDLTFLKIDDLQKVYTSSFLFQGHGDPKLPPNGDSVLSLNGNKDQYLTLLNKSVVCLDLITTCKHGFTLEISVFVIEKEGNERMYFFSSVNDNTTGGVYLYYDNGQLYYGFRFGYKSWSGSVKYSIVDYQWHSVILSWSDADGISLFENLKLLSESRTPVISLVSLTAVGDFKIGRGDMQQMSIIQVNNLKLWPYSMTVLIDHTIYTTEEKPTTSTNLPSLTTIASTGINPGILFTYLKVLGKVGNLIITSSYNITTHGAVEIEFSAGDEQVIKIDISLGGYLNIDTSKLICLNDVQKCGNGVTVTLTVQFIEINTTSKVYLLSRPPVHGGVGITIYYQTAKLFFEVIQVDELKKWSASVPFQTESSQWNALQLTWSAKLGLLVLNNDILLEVQTVYTSLTHVNVETGTSLTIGNALSSLPGVILYIREIGIGPVNASLFSLLSTSTTESPESTLLQTAIISSQFSKPSADRVTISPDYSTKPVASHVTGSLDTTYKVYTKATTTVSTSATQNNFININITGNIVYTSHLVMVSYGTVELHKDNNGQNILQVTNSNGSSLEIKSESSNCLNSNKGCSNGVSVLVNLSFIQVPTNKVIYVISNLENNSDGLGFYLYYYQNRIYYGFRAHNTTWSTDFEYILQLNYWHTYKLSFTKEYGAALYIDNQLFKFVTEQTSTRYFPHDLGHGTMIGSVTDSSSTVIFLLSGVEFLPSIELNYEVFTPQRIYFPTVQRNMTTSGIASLHGNIEVIVISPTHSVVQINTTTTSYIEVNSTGIKCVHSILDCSHGFTVELDVDIIYVSNELNRLQLYFFSNERQNGSFYLYYLNRELYFGVIIGSSIWASSLKYDIKPDVWNTYALSWSSRFGCALYINNHLVGQAANRYHVQEQSKEGLFTIGKSNGTGSVIFLVSGLKVWSMSYDMLIQYGIKNNNTSWQTTPVSVVSSGEQSLGPSLTPDTNNDITTQVYNGTNSTSETGVPNFAFVNITGNILYTNNQIFTVHGKPEIVIDKLTNRQVVQLSAASNAYIEINSKNLTCMNLESKCDRGITVGVVINIIEMEQSQTLYILSNFVKNSSGISFYAYYCNTTIYFGFKIANIVISTTVSYGLVPNSWHMIEISITHTYDSIGLIIDNKLIKLVTKETSTNQYPVLLDNGLTFGHVTDNDKTTTLLIGGIQFLQKVSPVLAQVFSMPSSATSAKTTPKPKPTTVAVTSASTPSTTRMTTKKPTTTKPTTMKPTTTKSTTPATTEPPIPTFHWNLSSIPSTNIIVGLKYNLTVYGTPITVDGGLDLQNSTQYIDLGGIKCLLNPITCSQGLTIQFAINIKFIQENTFLLTSGGQLPNGVGIAVLYRYGQYQFVVSTATQSWYATCGKDVLTLNKSHTIMLSWYHTIGLEIIIDNKQVQIVTNPTIHETSTVITTTVYVGKQPSTTIKYEYIIQTVTIWYARVDVLVVAGLCPKPDRPDQLTTASTVSASTKKVSTSPLTKFTGIVTTQNSQCPVGCVSIAKSTSKTDVTATSKQPDSGSDKSTPVSTTSKPPPSTTKPQKTTAPTTHTTTERAAPNYHTDLTITATYSTTDKEAYLVCAFTRPSEAGIEMTLALLIENKRVLVKTVAGDDGLATFSVSQVNMDLYRQKIQCSLVANYVGSSHSTQVFVSNTYIPDFTVKPATITVTEGRPGKHVTVHSTAPPQLYCCTGCKGQCQVHVVGTFILDRKDTRCYNNFISQAVIESAKPPNYNREICGFALTNTNWNSENTILVTATLDNRRDGTQKRELKIIVNVYNQPPTAQITVKPVAHVLSTHVQVTIHDNYHSPYTCKSVNDPHMLTFDGAHFNNMNEGQFVMFRHTELPFEVRSWYYKCSSRSHATCNCGVAIKSGDDVISVIGCHTVTSHGHPGHGHGIGLILQQLFGSHGNSHGHDREQFAKAPMMIQIYKNGELTPGTFIRRYGCGQKYEIQLPTGMIITVQQSYRPFINIWIKASSSDRGKSTGLCGNYNGVKDEWKNGNRGIDAFIQQHKAPTDNFFNGVGVSTLVSGSTYCSCIEGKGSVCSPGLGYMQCTTSRYDITAALLRQAKAPILTVSRQKRQVSTTDVAPTVIPDGSNMTKDQAVDECTEAILNNTVTNYCKPILTTNLTQQIENCAEDYLATGSFVWAKSALSDIAVNCVESASALLANNDTEGDFNTTSIDLPVPSNLEEILSKSCVDDCGTNGDCQEGICVCKDGYTGVTCEISRDTKPIVSSVPYLCDVSATVDCMGAVVYGDNFVNSSTLTCHFDYIEVLDTVKVTHQTRTVLAQFMSLNQVMCLLPWLQSARIKISNDGQTLSDSASPHVVFDSGCYNCLIRNDTTGYIPVCTRLENNCVIDGKCYQSAQNKPGDTCRNCNPAINDTVWSKNQEKAECTAQPVIMATSKTDDNENKVIALAVVSAVLAAILLVLVVHIVKSRSYSKAESGDYQVQPENKIHREDAFQANPIYNQQSEKL